MSKRWKNSQGVLKRFKNNDFEKKKNQNLKKCMLWICILCIWLHDFKEILLSYTVDSAILYDGFCYLIQSKYPGFCYLIRWVILLSYRSSLYKHSKLLKWFFFLKNSYIPFWLTVTRGPPNCITSKWLNNNTTS